MAVYAQPQCAWPGHDVRVFGLVLWKRSHDRRDIIAYTMTISSFILTIGTAALDASNLPVRPNNLALKEYNDNAD